MTTALHLAPTQPPPSLLDQLRAVDPPLLPDDGILRFDSSARIGGGNPCLATGCRRFKKRLQLCEIHWNRWRAQGEPALDKLDPGPPVALNSLDFTRLPESLRLELAYGLRCAEDSLPLELTLSALAALLRRLELAGIDSLLDVDESKWRGKYGRTVKMRIGILTFTIDHLEQLLGRGTREQEFTRDAWRLRHLGITGVSAGWIFQFSVITQPWLREAVKRFLRWRVDIGHSPSGMHRDMMTLTRLSQALTEVAGPHAPIEQFTRAVIERLLSLLIEDGLVANGRGMALASIRTFLTLVRQHNWLPDLDPQVGIYSEDMPRRTALPPRALPEFVMTQLEDQANLDRIPEERCRLLIPLLMQTGLRQGDGRFLPLDCLIVDAQNAPYLRYFNHKMKREAVVPITAEMASAITDRRALVLERHPDATFLFAKRSTKGLAATSAPSSRTVTTTMDKWLDECEIRDAQGNPVHVTPHQFRHTLGTRLINNDVPQEVVRQLLDHSSTEMTAHYARLHDTTVRDHWERARKVNIEGQTVAVSADSPLADAAWMNHHLSRATMALPNGYCGLPLQQSCPHANACLTCPVFITTPEFLDNHREQLAHTAKVLEGAKARKQLRLVEINQRVSDSLTNIITALEAEETDAG
jgi:integrase